MTTLRIALASGIALAVPGSPAARVDVAARHLTRVTRPPFVVRPWSPRLAFPVGLAFLPDGRALVTEKDAGNIRMIERNGSVRPKPFAHLRVFSGAEYGLLAVAVDPMFRRYPFVYAYYVEPTPDGKAALRARLVRFRVRNGVGVSMRVLVDNVRTNPETVHVGGALAFQGQNLLVAVGDGSPTRGDPRAQDAQDLSSVQGKVLRLTRDGNPVRKNPFGNRVFTFGHRNSYGLTVDRRTGAIFESENGLIRATR